ncbi:hypothetical protein AVEN_85682-1 [Araneus ventricosus]|uniref:Uncharacterized protein n=1 Tax=Araneus ventricosus TaxID=182803 RepID=A0A4Y2NIS9_ARAVE|nr:hypothetical protein AVEN_85682-1 [Araneus ventricosus]
MELKLWNSHLYSWNRRILLPYTWSDSDCGQLYIFDTSEANNRRMKNNQVCLHSVMEKLDSLLRSINPFGESYLQMHPLIQSNPAINVKMVFMEYLDLDLRRYNAPASRIEVAAIFVGHDGEPPANRDIFIYPVADSCKIILHLVSAGNLWFILFYFRMENAVVIPIWNMLRKDLRIVLGLNSCNIIHTGLLFAMHLAFYTTAENSFNSI